MFFYIFLPYFVVPRHARSLHQLCHSLPAGVLCGQHLLPHHGEDQARHDQGDEAGLESKNRCLHPVQTNPLKQNNPLADSNIDGKDKNI